MTCFLACVKATSTDMGSAHKSELSHLLLSVNLQCAYVSTLPLSEMLCSGKQVKTKCMQLWQWLHSCAVACTLDVSASANARLDDTRLCLSPSELRLMEAYAVVLTFTSEKERLVTLLMTVLSGDPWRATNDGFHTVANDAFAMHWV